MSMIPVKVDYNGEVLCCRVHDLMLDLIRVKCEEENFINVIDDPQAAMRQQKKIRRVNLQYSGMGYGLRQITINCSLFQARSIGFFTRVSMPSFLGFKYVRVLFLDFIFPDWSNRNVLAERDLTGVCGLFLLRYFKIASNSYFQLPNQLWGLQYLETMVIQTSGTVSVPSDISRLRRLLNLTSICYRISARN
ncbi:hypothetical protein QOZ80_5AG0384760 [Eleusine coracana subsp. coracana]|nr:hypothetical protein QOZ80_5AG0384760 [Eleusine coracana subsp. coracana]